MDKKEVRVFVIAILGLLVVGGLIAVGVSDASQNGTTLSAEKTGSAHYTRTFGWTIEKSVTPQVIDLFRGQSAPATYTITTTKDEGTLRGSIAGQICVTNGGTTATTGLAITDEVSIQLGGAPYTSVVTGPVDVSEKPVLEATESHCYNYDIEIPNAVPGGLYKNTAHVTILNHSGWLPGSHNCPGTEVCPFGPNPSADSLTTIMPTEPALVNSSITVNDSNPTAGNPFQFDASGSISYSQIYSCDGNKGDHLNTATINETQQSANATVTVNCYALDVRKNVSSNFTRTWSWIDGKLEASNITNLTLALGESFPLNFNVPVNISGSLDSDWSASGTITIMNPAPIDAHIASVTDSMSAPELGGTDQLGIPADVNCHASLPFIIAAGQSHECSYSAQLPNANTRTNTARVILTGNDVQTLSPGSVISRPIFISEPVSVDFGTAIINAVNNIVNVVDSIAGPLGTLNASDQLPHVYNYPGSVGPFAQCGLYTYTNRASVLNNTSTLSSANWTVNVSVPCRTGCTLTIGYWKNHAGLSKGGQADMVTAKLPKLLGTSGGAKTIAVSTATQAVSLLSFNGSNNVFDGSNGINKLYAQLLAAKLNISSGASPTAVSTVISSADAFLATKNSLDWGGLTKTQKNQVLSWMTTLDNYNNGLLTPGHCSEPPTVIN